MTWLQVYQLHWRICQRTAVRGSSLMLLHWLAELVNGRTCDHAGYGRQRWCYELCLGTWLFCQQMALSARWAGCWDWHCLGWAVEFAAPLGSVAMQSNNAPPFWCVVDWLLLSDVQSNNVTPSCSKPWMLVVDLRGFHLYCARAVPPPLPLVSQQSCGYGPVNGYWCQVDLKRAVLLKQVTASCSFDSGAGYRLSSLALVQAVAWLSERSSIMSAEMKERELLWGKAVAEYVGWQRKMCCVVRWLLPCGCSHKSIKLFIFPVGAV